MVANLQFRRKALESKILEKNQELKQLCIQEAELTGNLPPEIPLFPGETPPKFRRRVGTSFTYPENLINKLKYKEVNVFYFYICSLLLYLFMCSVDVCIMLTNIVKKSSTQLIA